MSTVITLSETENYQKIITKIKCCPGCVWREEKQDMVVGNHSDKNKTMLQEEYVDSLYVIQFTTTTISLLTITAIYNVLDFCYILSLNRILNRLGAVASSDTRARTDKSFQKTKELKKKSVIIYLWIIWTIYKSHTATHYLVKKVVKKFQPNQVVQTQQATTPPLPDAENPVRKLYQRFLKR